MTTDHVVRRVRVGDAPDVRASRLVALQDPAAPVAFLDTYETASARPLQFWEERVARAAEGDESAQYVAIDGDQWIASVTGLREDEDAVDWAGRRVPMLQAHVVGVWVHHDHRGAGLLGRLVAEVETWARSWGARRLRLLVHVDNARAQAAYAKIGFAPTGVTVALESGQSELEMARPL